MGPWHDRVPFADTTALVFLLTDIWSMISLVENYEWDNRAPIFRGARGQVFHLVLMTITTISAFSALTWIFLSIWWLRGFTIMWLAWCIAPWCFRRLPFYLSKTAIGSIALPLLLLALNFLVWGSMRP